MNQTASWSPQEKFQYRMSLIKSQTIYRLHGRLYRLSGGRIGATIRGIPVLLLTTTGRKTGLPRTRTLMYLRDGDDYVIVASNAGLDKPPAWWFNLKATPRVSVQVGSRELKAVAQIAGPAEHARLWQELVELNPFYAAYQGRTDRVLDVVVLRTS
jgi:deazaflavin-dependent oxidoreductase (nitroreductase family)